MSEQPFPDDQPVMVLVEVLEVIDTDKMQAYVAAIAPQMAAVGGRNVAAGFHSVVGQSEALNMVASVFPTARAYKDWQQSADYAPWKVTREAASRIRTHLLPLLPGAYAPFEGQQE